jgi:hypothetical protein
MVASACAAMLLMPKYRSIRTARSDTSLNLQPLASPIVRLRYLSAVLYPISISGLPQPIAHVLPCR